MSDRNQLQLIGEMLAAARKSAGLSLKALSETTGVSTSHILRMESGQQDFTVTKFCRLSDALGIPPALVLESALFHRRDFLPGEASLHSECGSLVVKLFGGARGKNGVVSAKKLDELGVIGERISWLVLPAAQVVQAILLSANPQIISKEMKFPIASVHERLVEFASVVDPLATTIERLGLLKSLHARPYSKLVAMGILNDGMVIDYLDSDGHKLISDPCLNVGKHLFAQPDEIKPTGSHYLLAAEKTRLTKKATSENIADVNIPPQWPMLKKQLQEATAKVGYKSKLAQFLKVDLTRISQWLSDAKNAREPGAEYALRMRYWVNLPEDKQ